MWSCNSPGVDSVDCSVGLVHVSFVSSGLVSQYSSHAGGLVSGVGC